MILVRGTISFPSADCKSALQPTAAVGASGSHTRTHRSVFEAGHSPPSTARQRMTGVISPPSHVSLCHASAMLTNLRLSYITGGFIWFLDLVLSIVRRQKLLTNGCISDHGTQHVAAQTQLNSGLISNLSSDI